MAGSVGLPCKGTYVTVDLPWTLDGNPIRVTVNQAVRRRFMLACKRAAEMPWKPKRVDSYNCRQIRGSTSWSRHAYACAWDLFHSRPGIPPPGGVWKPTNTFRPDFAACFTDLGFTWGGTWVSRPDMPHIEWSHSTVPELTRAEIDRTLKLHKARMDVRNR